MKIIRNKATHVVMFLLDDSEDFTLSDSSFQSDSITAIGINSQDYEVIDGEAPSSPLYWIEGCLSFSDGVWSIANQENYDSSLQSAKIEHERKQNEAAQSIRSQRNKMLIESDWTQVADAPVDQAAWATYRQALRDITEQDGFPLSVIYPEAP